MGERRDTEAQRRRILEAITGLQSAVLAGESSARAAFERALEVLLDATGSEYGFIGEALKDADGTPYLQTLAITDIAWDAASSEIAALARRSGLALRNLDTLLGAPMQTGETVIANDAPNDPRAGGLPPGHPPLRAFLGLPLKYGGEMIGLAGLANREGGFDDALIEDLAPLTTALAAMVVAERAKAERDRQSERAELALLGSDAAVWDWDIETGQVWWSPSLKVMLGVPPTFTPNFDFFLSRIHSEDRESVTGAIDATLQRGAPYHHVFRLKRTCGGYATIRSTGQLVRDASGAPARLVGVQIDISREVMLEGRAKDAYETHNLMVSAAGLAAMRWEPEDGVIYLNDRFSAMVGRPELAGLPVPAQDVEAMVHPDDRADVLARLNRVRKGEVFGMEHRVLTRTGEVLWVKGHAGRLETSDGATVVLGVLVDRTAAKRAELELAEAKLRYDVAISGSYAAIWDQNLITGEIFWTARLGEILGLGAEARTEPLQDFLARTHPDDLEHARQKAREAIETGEPLDNVLRVRRADGVYRHLRSRAAVLFDETGRAIRLCGSIIDITDELEAEAKARLSGRRAELALQAAHLGVWDYEADTGGVTCDRTLAELLGAPELAGRALTQDQIMAFTHPDDLAGVRADLARLHRCELASIGNEHRIVRRNGDEIWVRADVGVAERDSEGAVTRLIGIVQDLTGVKLTEELLRKSADHARRASEAKSQFLATMSHEIRTPLNGVLGVVQLLERTPLDTRQRRYVETIKASGRSLAEVIEDVLDISRIEAGRLELKPEPSMIPDVLDQAAAPSRALASQKGVALNMTVSGDLAEPAFIDPRRVAQMVGNLIGNAVKFTEQGGVRVRALRPERGLLRIEVEDDGPGLPEDMHEAVFERFTQVDMSHSRPHQGTGLGLAIVRELAQLAGGVAGVRSRPGEGACFWIELPAPAAHREAKPDQGSVKARGSGPLRVLVVEDHPVNRAVTAELVSQTGHVCETADSGEDALAALAVRPMDLVLLDLHMPGLDGAETLSRIRRGEAGPRDVPVYMLSADATPEARAKTLALGADGYFVKPLDAGALRRRLAELAERKRMTG